MLPLPLRGIREGAPSLGEQGKGRHEVVAEEQPQLLIRAGLGCCGCGIRASREVETLQGSRRCFCACSGDMPGHGDEQEHKWPERSRASRKRPSLGEGERTLTGTGESQPASALCLVPAKRALARGRTSLVRSPGPELRAGHTEMPCVSAVLQGRQRVEVGSAFLIQQPLLFDHHH